MKKSTKIFTLLLSLALVFCFTACNVSDITSSDASSTTSTQTVNTVQKVGVWEDAVYLSDATVGEGEKTLTLRISAENQIITLKVLTNAETVGDALLNEGIIDGEKSQYGLYIKKVNGITADYDVNKAYWAFYTDGNYASAGVDQTKIDEKVTYKLEYTK